MTKLRRLILAALLALSAAPAFGQAAPPPVPALPDTERRTSYSISASTCACAVNFALFGDSTDYQSWVEVFINGIPATYSDATTGWTITSPTGSLSTIPRPITDAVLTFNQPVTGTIQIVGARRPRRAAQFSENRGVAARDLNQVLTDIIAQNRETWDKTNDVSGRAVLAVPGETMALLPVLASRANMGACFDNGGNLTSCISVASGTFTAGSGILFTGTNPTTISNNITAGTGIQITGTNPKVIATTPGVDTNTLNSVTANYTIQASDAGKTVMATGGLFTITLPAAGTISGTLPTFSVIVCNGDANNNTGRAKKLSGFPDPLFARLWMNQCAGVKIVNGVWVLTAKPGRWRPTFQPTFFVDNGGSNANDGFISNAAANALQTIGQCVAIVYNELDLTEGLYPICTMTGGQTFAESVTLTNSVPYGLLIYFTGNGGIPIWRPTVTTGSFPLFLSDYGVAILQSVTMDCTGGAHPCNCVAMHQYTILDMSDANVKCIGANGTDIGIDCDAQCRINVNNGLSVQGTFQSIFRLRYGTMGQFGNVLTAVAAPTIANLIEMYSNSAFVFQGNTTFAGAWGGMRKYYVLGRSTLTDFTGTGLPGGTAGVSSGVAGAVDGGVCTVLC